MIDEKIPFGIIITEDLMDNGEIKVTVLVQKGHRCPSVGTRIVLDEHLENHSLEKEKTNG